MPAKAALAAADECIAKGVKAAVMFSSGFAETGAEGRALQVELTRRCRAGGMKLLGPNSLGMFNVHDGALFAPSRPISIRSGRAPARSAS